METKLWQALLIFVFGIVFIFGMIYSVDVNTKREYAVKYEIYDVIHDKTYRVDHFLRTRNYIRFNDLETGEEDIAWMFPNIQIRKITPLEDEDGNSD